MKYTKFFILVILFVLVFTASNHAQAARKEPLIIDHTSIFLFDQIPEIYLDEARVKLKIAYGHTSHGSQIVSGMEYLKNNLGAKYDYSSLNSKCDRSAFLCDRYPAGDLGNPTRTKWSMRTRELLNNNNPYNRNVVMWSWCGQHNTSKDNIKIYLDQMMQLEHDYPQVDFVYMTGHLNSGDGYPDGNTYLRNQQVRDYAIENDKILFDFADIESWDPDGNDYRADDDACEWCDGWCASHSSQCQDLPSCAHSHGFNCIQKGKAFWVMAAILAGWDPELPVSEQEITTTKIESLGARQYINKSEASQFNKQIKHNQSLAKKIKGRMLLRVENRGEIWYVSPTDEKKYQVTFDNALYLFQNLALGVSNENLEKIPESGAGEAGDINLRNKLKGYLLLQVEENGKIWFVGQDGFRYQITWENLMDIFESLALGISERDLSQIHYGGLEKLQ